MSTTPGPTESRSNRPRRGGWVWAAPVGDEPGWVLAEDAFRAGWSVVEADPELAPWRSDLWLSYKMDLALQRGLSGDLNPVQEALIVAGKILRREEDAARREGEFIDLMFVTNQEMYRAYRKSKQQEELASSVEWAAPSSPEELMELARQIGRVADADGGWEVAYSEHDATLRVVDSPFDGDDLKGMSD